MFMKVHHFTLFWATWIQSTPSHPVPLRSILILSSHLNTDPPSCLFPSHFPTKVFSSLHATCSCLISASLIQSEAIKTDRSINGCHGAHVWSFFVLMSEICSTDDVKSRFSSYRQSRYFKILRKLKFFLSTPLRLVGRTQVQYRSFVTQHYMELRGQLLAPGTSIPQKNPRTHWIGGWVGSRAGSVSWRRQKKLPLSGFKPRTVDPIV
jgi:hypothetical protein